jgi:hypothetical protein
MTSLRHVSPVIKRHSLLRRHADFTRTAFSDYYLNVHGPLATAQSGFRKFTYRYVQNHIDADLLNDHEPKFDGITMTSQVPRANYRRGFFQEPDYANVKPDEERLFDVPATVSVLGEERVLFERASDGEKSVIVLSSSPPGTDPDPVTIDRIVGKWRGIRRLVSNHLQTDSASALGFAASSFPYDLLCEVWFDTIETRRAASHDHDFHAALAGADAPTPSEPLVFAVREIIIFSRPRPSSEALE